VNAHQPRLGISPAHWLLNSDTPHLCRLAKRGTSRPTSAWTYGGTTARTPSSNRLSGARTNSRSASASGSSGNFSVNGRQPPVSNTARAALARLSATDQPGLTDASLAGDQDHRPALG